MPAPNPSEIHSMLQQNHNCLVTASHLLEGNETGRVGGTNTGTTVLDWLAAECVSCCTATILSGVQTY